MKEDEINKELKRIGIPLNHEHALYFKDGVNFALKKTCDICNKKPVTNRICNDCIFEF